MVVFQAISFFVPIIYNAVGNAASVYFFAVIIFFNVVNVPADGTFVYTVFGGFIGLADSFPIFKFVI